ncbi:aminotransferase class V-fold PLP-dependent enzyme [Actinomyces slackii]|uniref:cysteine desulfurase n=1 Tax=Actinomyces slackii TaxID=52774 RepID=A0A3S4U0P5_9ACTO|nr:cysteine desulfurase [Actinomyces slackii]VEG73608.1 Probable cysteine desulfurase [Actinomyces slackii]
MDTTSNHGHLSSLEQLRHDFPTITADSDIYLDSVASSLTPMPVVDAMTEYYTRYRANIHRGTYDLSMRASERYEDAVAAVARFINASPSEIAFTQNTTHAINIIAHTLDFTPGDEIVLTSIEHTSNMAPWVSLASAKGLELKWYNAGRDGIVDAEELAALIGPRTKLVTMTALSNVLGTVTPIEAVGKACRANGTMFMVDAAQAAPHVPLDVRRIDCDFLAFSGHKMLGPTGIGVLYIREALALEMMPGMLGGGTLDTAKCDCPSLEECSLDYCSYSELPDKWQPGTPPIAEAFGLHAAIRYIEEVGMDVIERHDRALTSRFMRSLEQIPGIDIYGPSNPEQRMAVVSFNVGDIDPNEIGRILNERYHIAVRTGQHCAVNYFNDVAGHPGSSGNVRASFYLYNTEDEVDAAASAISEISAKLIRS